MLQDNKSARTSANGGTTDGAERHGGKKLSRRMTGNGCSRRSDRSYNMGSATDLMINDYDDERTLDEEEALEGSEDQYNELSNLQKEGDMPLKELLAKYGYIGEPAENSESSDQMNAMPGNVVEGGVASEKGENDAEEYEDEDEEDEEEEEDEEAEDDEDEEEEEDDENNVAGKVGGDKMLKQLSLREFYVDMIKNDDKRMGIDGGPNAADGVECDNDGDCRMEEETGSLSRCGGSATVGTCNEEASDLRGRGTDEIGNSSDVVSSRGVTGLVVSSGAGVVGVGGGGSSGGGSSRLLRSVSRPQSEEEDDDCDYSPDEEEWKKTIMVGSDFQATIPEGLCRYDDALPYENEDKILWNPTFIPEEAVEEYLDRAQLPNVKTSMGLPAGNHVRDDEQALYLLLQCGYNLEEALRRRRMNVLPPTDSISLWSEEECHNFESGLRAFGKDFHLIQRNKVRTRSVGELVQFYYLWKKTERHDIFTYKARMEKKKYVLHPGITDYMDRFLEEQEGVRDRSSSPNVNSSLLYGDAKRQRTSSNTLANNHSEEVKSVDAWDGLTTDDSLGDLNNPTTTGTTTTSPTMPASSATAATTTTTTTTTTPSSTSSSSAGESLSTIQNSPTTPPPPPTITSAPLGSTPGDTPTTPNHTNDTPRHGYSPSPENVLSNLPP